MSSKLDVLYVVSPHEQGTDAWLEERLGVITGTSVKHLMTPTGKAAKGDKVESLCRLKAAERVFNFSDPQVNSYWTKRGNDLEPYARQAYTMKHGTEIVQAGIIYYDNNRTFGVSVDGVIVNKHGMIEHTVEIKCLNLLNHSSIIIDHEIPLEHKAQVQAGLLATDASGCEFIAYHPECGLFSMLIDRDKPYIEVMKGAIERALVRISELELLLRGGKS